DLTKYISKNKTHARIFSNWQVDKQLLLTGNWDIDVKGDVEVAADIETGSVALNGKNIRLGDVKNKKLAAIRGLLGNVTLNSRETIDGSWGIVEAAGDINISADKVLWGATVTSYPEV